MDGSTSEVKSYWKIVISNPVLQLVRKWTSVLQLQQHRKFNKCTVITLPFRKLLIWTQSSLADLISESDIPMGANLTSPKPLSPHFWAEKLTGLRDEQFISTASTATTKVDTKNTQQWLYKAHTLPACKKSVNDTSQHWGSSLTMEWFRQDGIKKMTASGFKCLCHTIADIVVVSTFHLPQHKLICMQAVWCSLLPCVMPCSELLAYCLKF